MGEAAEQNIDDGLAFDWINDDTPRIEDEEHEKGCENPWCPTCYGKVNEDTRRHDGTS